ncbi:hypothetical protein F5878DRAFT_640831 [Lentinula raphanica]|uniref:Uncharacterized protein n=1 Tax=Lentinula raphanica TaxID=153919 RepID=A0AA38PBZ5_9AGAR|nr:hypothetical protein F5878DRAFT_640831 [Lentinula raphanica]
MARRSRRVLRTIFASRRSRSTSLADGRGFLYAFIDNGYRWKIGMSKNFARRQKQWDRQCPCSNRDWKPPIAVRRRRRADAGTSSTGTEVLRQALCPMFSLSQSSPQSVRLHLESFNHLEKDYSSAPFEGCKDLQFSSTINTCNIVHKISTQVAICVPPLKKLQQACRKTTLIKINNIKTMARTLELGGISGDSRDENIFPDVVPMRGPVEKLDVPPCTFCKHNNDRS